MSSSRPRIAVLIPSRNAEHTIGQTLNSLNANSEPHDIVIVDDGGDRPLKDLIPAQPNMTILRLDKNVGITRALNHGLKYILEQGYDYVARMDADDAAMSNRFATQLSFMDHHPDVALVGSCGEVVSERGDLLFHLNFPTGFDAIQRELYYNSCFLHPTFMIRATALRNYGFYSEDYPNAEDYELVRRFSQKTRVANQPQYLIRYTVSTKGLSVSKRRQQLRSRLLVQWHYRNLCNIHFYLGILKTYILWCMPMSLITAIKQQLPSYQAKPAAPD